MERCANIYDICDQVILKEQARAEPGVNLRLLYRRSAGNLLLKNLVLKGCRHPAIRRTDIPIYRNMIRAAMQATVDAWQDPQWIDSTFAPLAALLDRIEDPCWQVRKPVTAAAVPASAAGAAGRPSAVSPSREEIRNIARACLRDILKVWRRDRQDPWFPVAAQVVLSGDDHMDGQSLLGVLRGVGSYEYQNITMLFQLIRCFIMANPRKLALIRRRYQGISEPMRQRTQWIWHRIAFSDMNFFEHLWVYLTQGRPPRKEAQAILAIMENLVRYCVVTSREWLVTPNNGIRHPAITCLPKDEQGRPLCRLTEGAWRKKRELGFGDYIPDTDTTFLSLAMAKRWLDLAETVGLPVDQALLEECRRFLDHPWVQILSEYQVGGEHCSDPPTIHITRPLDYEGSVPIWFHKTFQKPGDRVVLAATGNEICPGHNMDILEAILLNRKRWSALQGENLRFVHRLLDFHYRAYTSGNFKYESAHKYYLPEIYVYYTGRMYQRYLNLSAAEKRRLDPQGKVRQMRRIALDYCREELLGYTVNPFDAALAVTALVLLDHEPKDDGLIASGLKVLSGSLGEGKRGHPYRAYEWNRMRHPIRILVGSEISTSLFVLRACTEALRFPHEDPGVALNP